MNTYGPEYQSWLASLKVGDSWEAIKPCRWSHGEIITFCITGETAKQFKVGMGAYCKGNGRLVGSGSYGAYLLPPATEDELSSLRAQIKLHNLRHKLSRVRWEEFGSEALTAIDEILEKASKA